MSDAVKAIYETSADPLVADLAQRREESRIFYELELAGTREEAEREGRLAGEKEGRLAGEKEGRLAGEKEGRLAGQRLILGKQLRLRFQLRSLPPPVERRLEVATSDELTRWAERIFSATTLDDIFA